MAAAGTVVEHRQKYTPFSNNVQCQEIDIVRLSTKLSIDTLINKGEENHQKRACTYFGEKVHTM